MTYSARALSVVSLELVGTWWTYLDLVIQTVSAYLNKSEGHKAFSVVYDCAWYVTKQWTNSEVQKGGNINFFVYI